MIVWCQQLIILHGACYKQKEKVNVSYLLQCCLNETQDQKHFTTSAVAADWHKLMKLQCIKWPSTVVHTSKKLEPGCRHTTAQSATQGLQPTAHMLLTTHCAYTWTDGRSELTWMTGCISKWFTRQHAVIHTSANQAAHGWDLNSQHVDYKSELP